MQYKQEKQKSGTGQIKKIVSNLDHNRKNVDAGKDIAKSIQNSKQSFGEFENIIKGQTSSISSLKDFQKTIGTGNARNLQTKKFLSIFLDWMKQELINKYFKICEQQFRWGTHKSSQQEQINKLKSEYSKIIQQTKDESDTPQKIFKAIMKMLSVRENMQCQILRVMIYKKNVLWRDLNMKYDDYIHGQVKSALNKIKQSEQKFGYVPSSIEFKLPKLEGEQQANKLSDLFAIILSDHNQLIESMKNFSKLSEQPQLIDDISQNQPIVAGLRQKIQALTKNYNSLMEKYRGLQISKGKVQLGAAQQKSLSDKIEDLENLLMKKQQDIIEFKQISIKAQSSMQSLKDKNKELEEQVAKWTNYQMPKIKQLQNNQRALLQQFSKTKKDFDTYSGIYQTERQQKIKAYEQLKLQKIRLSEMANILGRERRKIKQLKEQLNRKQQIIMELVDKAPEP